MVLLVCLGVALGALGIYAPFLDFAGAGASVPLCGFRLQSMGGRQGRHQHEGFLGIFKGGFSACAIGISATLLAGFLAALIFKPKTKK